MKKSIKALAGFVCISLIIACTVYFCSTAVRTTPAAYPYNKAEVKAYKPDSKMIRIACPEAMLTPDGTLAKEDHSAFYGSGMEKKLTEQFAELNNYKIRWVPTKSCDEALKLLADKRCNLVAGYGGELTEAQKSKLAPGPVYAYFNPVMIDINIALAAGDFFIKAKPESIKRINHPTNINTITSVENGPTFLLDPAAYTMLVPAGQNPQDFAGKAVGYRWFWRNDEYIFARSAEKFWQNSEIKNMVAQMRERYYGFIPTKPKQADLVHLSKVISKKLHNYSAPILKASQKYDLDPILLAAVIFQESRFDPSATSYTGVRGIMQLTSNTAEMLNVDRLNPEQSIMGGARYLSQIWKSMDGMNIDDMDRWCFTLAGYNQGPTVLKRALNSVRKSGEELTWNNMRVIYPKLKRMGLAGEHFRGGEAVHYVENVRYYYYIMSGLATISLPEYKDLTAFLVAYRGF